MVHTLQTGAVDFIDASKVKVVKDSVENLIINEVANAPSVDYSDPEQRHLLIKLARQTVAHFRTYLTEEEDVLNVVVNYKKIIGEYIYTQMKTHFYEELPDFYEPVIDVRAYTKIKDHNFSKYKSDNIFDYRETIEPTREIPRKVFSGFKKACHQLYSFDSKTEKDFAIICEQDRAVVKWLRPALNQFNIYYRHGSKQYSPDFVVQTADTTYMVETKKAMDIETRDVQDKARAAAEYCRHATTYNGTHGGNPWKYVIIPHDAVKVNMDFLTLVERYVYVGEKEGV